MQNISVPLEEETGEIANCYKPRGASFRVTEVRARSGPRKRVAFRAEPSGLACGIWDGQHAVVPGVKCTSAFSSHLSAAGKIHVAQIGPDGKVDRCAEPIDSTEDGCEWGNVKGTGPKYPFGKRISVGRFSCEVIKRGVKCLVVATGRGFLMTPKTTRAVRSQGRNPTSFLSPDRKVWCQYEEFESPPAVTCGTEPTPPTRSAWLDSNGKVSLCEVLQLEYPPGSRIPLGCYQNWPAPHDGTPVLNYGQHSDLGDFRCTSAAAGISCIKVSGTETGHGFRVNKDEAVELDA